MIDLERVPGEVKKKSVGLFLWAGVLVALGSGNLVYGTHKLNQYNRIAATAEAKPSPAPLLSTNKIQVEKEHARIESRQDFYALVTIGGKIFIGFGLVILLWTLLFQKRLDVSEKF